MRIYLQCPFSEKDIVKGLGARWDYERKSWYIEDVEDLTPYMRWIESEGWIPPVRLNRYSSAEVIKKEQQRNKNPRITEPTGGFKSLCDCDVLPWEDCDHFYQLETTAFFELIGQ